MLLKVIYLNNVYKKGWLSKVFNYLTRQGSNPAIDTGERENGRGNSLQKIQRLYFSHVRTFYEQAVNDLDMSMHRSIWI
jgi:hypothetical protein